MDSIIAAFASAKFDARGPQLHAAYQVVVEQVEVDFDAQAGAIGHVHKAVFVDGDGIPDAEAERILRNQDFEVLAVAEWRRFRARETGDAEASPISLQWPCGPVLEDDP
jgi:hypothetical protein